jgi:hypothetical protein
LPQFKEYTLGKEVPEYILGHPAREQYAATFRFEEAYFRQAWKEEWLEIKEILEDKVRTFGGGSAHFDQLQKMLHGGQNDNLKNFAWSYYGWTPYLGGVDRLAKALNVFRLKAMRDWSAWDRKFYLMVRIYTIRLRGLEEWAALNGGLSKWAKSAHFHIARVLCCPWYIMDDGSVWSWPWSNPSGSGATTADNILGHVMTEFRMMLDAKTDLEYEQAVQALIAIFGDDHVGGYPEYLAPMCEEASFRAIVDKAIGLPVKLLVCGEIEVEELRFLGFAFKRILVGDMEFYIPVYDPTRLIDAFRYNIRSMSEEQELSKAYSLLIMSWGTPALYALFAAAYATMLRAAEPSAAVERWRLRGVPTHVQVRGFYIGLECMEGDGHKKESMNGGQVKKQLEKLKNFNARIQDRDNGEGTQGGPRKRGLPGGTSEGAARGGKQAQGRPGKPARAAGKGASSGGPVARRYEGGGGSNSDHRATLGPTRSLSIPNRTLAHHELLKPGVHAWAGYDMHPSSTKPGARLNGIVSNKTISVADVRSALKSLQKSGHIKPDPKGPTFATTKLQNEAMLAALVRRKTAEKELAKVTRELGQEVADKKLPNVGPLMSRLSSAKEKLAAVKEETAKEMEGLKERGVPLTHSFELSGQMEEREQREMGDGHEVVIEGTCFLTSVTTCNIAQLAGYVLYQQPLSPAFIPESRLAVLTGLYDMYAIEEMVIEYRPIVSATVGGVLVGYCEPDVSVDESGWLQGESAVRDAMSHPGSELNSLFSPGAYLISFPQQQLYFCRNNDQPNLMIASMFNMMAGSGITPSISVGVLMMHYRVRFLQGSLQPTSFGAYAFSAGPTVVSFAGVSLAINGAFFAPVGNWAGITWTRDKVVSAIISNVTDMTTPISWRQLRQGDGTAVVSLAGGARIWARIDTTAVNIIFYPSMGAAIQGISGVIGMYSDGYYNTAANVPVASTAISFSNAEIFSLPVEIV